MDYEHQHCYADGSESFFRLVYEVDEEELCSESGTSSTNFILREAHIITEDGEVELTYNEKTDEFEWLPSRPDYDDVYREFEFQTWTSWVSSLAPF